MTLLSSPGARAGSWTYVVKSDNTGTTFTNNGVVQVVPPYSPGSSGAGSNNIAIPGYSIDRSINGSGGSGCDIHVIVHAQVTLTWVPTPGQTDPPPDNVLILERANAGWSATAGDAQHPGTVSGKTTNGLSDAEVDVTQSSYSKSGSSVNPANRNPSDLRGEHLTSYPASSGTVTLPNRTIECRATAVANWYYGASAGFGTYSVSIHPQPYNFRRVNAYNGTPPTSSILVGAGDLHCHLEWDSTTGYLASDGTHPDLAAIELHENVEAPTSPTATDAKGVKFYETDTPPFFWNPPLHFASIVVMADAGAIVDHYTWGAGEGISLRNSFQPPYKVDSFNETQTYKFHDPATMKSGVQEMLPGDAGPLTIKEAVIADSKSPSGYSYQVTRGSVSSNPIPLP